MRRNFTTSVSYDGQSVFATILPEHRKDGMYYEVNIPGIDRFFMHWSPLDRYDVVDENLSLPYSLILAVSDAIEEQVKSF